jgi:hypothetical protein
MVGQIKLQLNFVKKDIMMRYINNNMLHSSNE